MSPPRRRTDVAIVGPTRSAAPARMPGGAAATATVLGLPRARSLQPRWRQLAQRLGLPCFLSERGPKALPKWDAS
jgi:hypothetical protein